MEENQNSTEEVVDTEKKVGKQVLNVIGKTLGKIIKPVLIISIILILLVSCIYIIFKEDTADNIIKKITFEEYLEED